MGTNSTAAPEDPSGPSPARNSTTSVPATAAGNASDTDSAAAATDTVDTVDTLDTGRESDTATSSPNANAPAPCGCYGNVNSQSDVNSQSETAERFSLAYRIVVLLVSAAILFCTAVCCWRHCSKVRPTFDMQLYAVIILAGAVSCLLTVFKGEPLEKDALYIFAVCTEHLETQLTPSSLDGRC